MQQIKHHIDKLLSRLLVIIFAVLIVDVVWQVFSRYVLDRSFSFTEELARYALIWLSLLGAAYLNGQREHLSMDYFLMRCSPATKARRQRVIELLMLLFSLLVLVIGGGILVYTSFDLGQRTAAMDISLGWIYLVVPVSGLLIAFYSLYHIINTD